MPTPLTTVKIELHKNKKVKKQKNFLQKTSPALSIMLSVVLISVIVLFSIGVTTIVVDSARQGANVKQGTTAYYAAEAGIEQALWVNKKLTDTGSSIGANTNGNFDSATTFKIQGTPKNFTEQTVNGKYIVPFPWTGNAPWHGEASVPQGGCNPEKPPTRTGTGSSKTFKGIGIAGAEVTLYEIDHPCNWNRLKVGEKATIPLYSINTATSPATITNYDDFRLRIRLPCKEGAEICAPQDRLELNCFDKGDDEKKCVGAGIQAAKDKYRGEIVMLWEINAEGASLGESYSMTPLEDIDTSSALNFYGSTDTQLYENRINEKRKSANCNPAALDLNCYTMLNLQSDSADGTNAYPVVDPSGSQIDSGSKVIKQFLMDYLHPVMNLSVVGNLIGCQGKNSCAVTDYQGSSGYPYNVPYIEYQVILDQASGSLLPTNKENVISAEGQSGPFDQTIQVKVPHDNSSLEYVIQQ